MIRSRVPLFVAAASATLLLAGCVGGGADPTPKPSPSDAPLFSSGEEALKAAEKAYQAYLDVSNALGASGWVDPSGLREVATGNALKGDEEGAKDFASKGLKQLGSRTFDSMRVQSVSDSLTTYVCIDVSQTDVVDQSGNSIVSADRPGRVPVVVTFDSVKEHLLLSESKTWSGENFC
ncbi:hypothetical protein [Schumannella sp. 10F1B-5-1]|uniref:hypothetical protein n=1 Tax=Schumannella sp. 10F1B-5-1 TaxID=2590780 RepID=UPI0011321DD0|nr:hypothetical protein [Schumannella sp. 10F1B-5-1]TPW73072.1 hypothetical protein FJ658_07450 [Schumannella sp. 10F1B-5-1]